MKTISKKLIVNEHLQPVEVIIPWQEYQTIEQLLKLNQQDSELPTHASDQPCYTKLNFSEEEAILTDSSTVPPKAAAQSLLKFAGSWVGDDLSECLRQVYQLRGKTLL